MKKQKISDAITNINDKYIDEALNFSKKEKKFNKRVWLKWGAFAACFVIVVVAAFNAGTLSRSNNKTTSDGINESLKEEHKEYFDAELMGNTSDNSMITDSTATEDVITESPGIEGGYTTDDRKIILTAVYEIETKDIDKTVQVLENSVKMAGGYYESSSVSGSTQTGGRGRYVIRIPTDKLEGFTSKVDEFGKIITQKRTGKDITTEYYDVEAELASLKIQQDRLLELLKKADDLSEILDIETELTHVRKNIEALATTLKKYDNLIDYTTVEITITQVESYTKIKEPSFISEVGETFKNAFLFAWELAENIILALIWALPYLIVIAVIIVVIIIKIRKKNK